MTRLSSKCDYRATLDIVNRPGTWRVFLLIAITVAVYRWLGVGASLIAILGFMLSDLFIPPLRHRKFPDQDKQVVDNELGILGNPYREDVPDF
jgi:hypothetical protein